MVDTPTSRYRLRKQELGTNTNTWGDTKLNEVIDAVDQILGGVESIALTGDLTLTTTNYTIADPSKNHTLVFTGTLVSAVNVVVPSVESAYLIVNTAGAAVTVKTSAGAGVAVAHGFQTQVYCNGIDVLNGAPTSFPTSDIQIAGKIIGLTAGTAASHAINKQQMDTALAAITSSATPGTLRVTSTDTTAKFLDAAIAVSGITKAVQDSGANETLLLTSVPYWSEPRLVSASDSPVTAANRDIIEVRTSTGAVEIHLSASGRVIVRDVDGQASTNNITINPPASGSIMDGAVDEAAVISANWFSACFSQRPSGTNWSVS